MLLVLNPEELEALDRQDPATGGDGGWQSLLVKLQRAVNRQTNELLLDADDIARIQRCAFEYGKGGWESRLRTIFERHLGPNLNGQF